MSFEISSLDLENLNADEVEARMLRLESIAEGLNTGIELRTGVVHDFVIRLQSILGQALNDRLDTVGSSLNPLAAPIGAPMESDVLDATAAFYGIDRVAATSNLGQITIVVSERRTIIIPNNAAFKASDGRVFRSISSFAARTSEAEVRVASDRLLLARPDGKYEFTISAQSVDAGAGGTLPASSALSPSEFSVPSFDSAFAATAFSGGLSEETDEELTERIRRAIPAKSLSSRASVAAYITEPGAFPDTLAISTIGFGDSEMQRTKRTGLNVSGGAVDTYVRYNALPSTLAASLEAQVVSIPAGGKAVWQVVIGRDVAPGFYRVIGVKDASGESLAISSFERGVDNSPIDGEQVPVIQSATDGAFSRYQTGTLQFESNSTGLSLGDTQNVSLEIEYTPNISAIQSKVGNRDYRFVGGDTLVRAAVPVYVSVMVTVHAKPGITLSNSADVKSAIANYFNTSGFPGTLHTSRVAGLVNGYLPIGADVASVEVVLETIKPDGSIDRRRQTGEIDALNDPANSTTARTCVFYCNPGSIVLSAYQENIPTTA